jgi:hypothetical protein
MSYIILKRGALRWRESQVPDLSRERQEDTGWTGASTRDSGRR